MATKFNLKLINLLKGATYVRDLKEAIAIKDTWGYAHLKNTHPALCALYADAKKLPKTQKEATEHQIRYYLPGNIYGNPEVPVEIQEGYKLIEEELACKGLVPLKGVFLMPNIISKELSWWAWDTGLNGRWFTRKGKPATPHNNPEGWYHSSVRTYVSRIKKGLPLYTDK